MQAHSRLLLASVASVAATAIFAFAVGTASANRLENPVAERGFRAVWSPLTLEVGGRKIVCPITTEGSFVARTMVKRVGVSVVKLTGIRIGACSEGTATALTETLPWEVKYSSYEGTLPNISRVTLTGVGVSVRIVTGGVACLLRTEPLEPVRGIVEVSAGRVVTMTADPTAGIGTAGGFLCEFGTKAHFAGTASVTVTGGTESPQLRLI